MDRDDAGVLLDRDNKGRRKSLGGTSTALAARVETSVDPIRHDRPPLAQVAIGPCASEGFGVTPDSERELVEVRLAVLTLPWVVIGGREDRTRGVEGKRVSVRVGLGGRRYTKKNTSKNHKYT